MFDIKTFDGMYGVLSEYSIDTNNVYRGSGIVE